MFNIFKKKDTYLPKINDVVRYIDNSDYMLVIGINNSVCNSLELMDPEGSTFNSPPNLISRVDFPGHRLLSEHQANKYFNRTPEQIRNRKVFQRLRYLTSDEDVRTYFRIDALKQLVERNIDQGGV